MWRPNSLLEAIAAGETIDLATDRHGRHMCPNCGVTRPAAVIVDVRHLPIPEQWACDACWTKWERTGRVVDGGPALTVAGDVRARAGEWKRRWVTAHKAPAEIIRKFAQ